MEQCDLCFNYFEKSYLLSHKTKIHRVLKSVQKRKNFKCKECSVTFEFKAELYKHQTEDHSNLEETCKICGEKILRKNLPDHKLKIHGVKPKSEYTCHQCQKIFTTRSDLQRHKFDAHCLPGVGRPVAPCEICNKTFLKTSMLRHKFEVHGIRDEVNLRKGKGAKCDMCGKKFERKYELAKHMADHDKGKKFCNLCKKEVDEESLKKHKIKFHKPEGKPPIPRKNFKCADCSEIFGSRKIYISHRKIAHLGLLKEFQCNMCLDSFDTEGAFELHLKEFGNHDGKFSCSFCDVTFQSEAGLRMHLNKHQQKFTCDICNMSLSSNASLITHKTKHSNLKPYKCEICSKSFPYSSSLKYHLRTHEDKKIVCQFCGQKFTFSFNYTRHIEQNHGKPEEKLVCEHCGRLFAKRRMKDHLARHGEATLPCDLCGKKFKVLNQVRKHKNQVHKKELARYECSICGKTFIKKENLESHMIKHNMEQESAVKVDNLEPVTINLPQVVLFYN